MSTSAMSAQGTKLYIEDTGSPTQRALITERLRINGPNESRPRHDVTDLDSTMREYKAGLRDGGELQLEFFYKPSNTVHARVRAAYTATSSTDRNKQWEILWTDNSYWRFQGEITAWSVSNVQVDGEVTATITIAISGTITEV